MLLYCFFNPLSYGFVIFDTNDAIYSFALQWTPRDPMPARISSATCSGYSVLVYASFFDGYRVFVGIVSFCHVKSCEITMYIF